jgi:RND family efflux transporter MFP subunit
VEVAAVTTGSLARETMVSGILEPIRTVGVNAQLPGALTAVHVEEGDYVRAGQVMAEVDAREIAAQVRSAEAALAFARSTAERTEQLYKEKIVTAMEHERDRAALLAAQATLDQLRTRLGYASVRAPMAGVVTEKRVEAGDVVQSQTRLFAVADVSTLVALMQVSELDVSGIGTGQGVDLTVDALGGIGFRGVVRRVFPAADTSTRMVPVEVAISGPSARRLKPGYMARATFKLGERPGVILVPSSAVVGSGDARGVFVVEGDHVERRPVRLGQSSGGRVEVLDGVRAGETVVVAGANDLRDGAQVRVVRPVGASEAARPVGSPRAAGPRTGPGTGARTGGNPR